MSWFSTGNSMAPHYHQVMLSDLLQKFGFSLVKVMKDKNIDGVDEYLLIHYSVTELHKNLDCYINKLISLKSGANFDSIFK